MPSTWAETSRDYIENRENEIVNNHAQYCSVVKTGIGNTVMIIGGEVDAGKSLPHSKVHNTDKYKYGIANPQMVVPSPGWN
jgi:RAT1-interacting protein